MTGPDGFEVFDFDLCTAAWAEAALKVARGIAKKPVMRGADNLRHQKTWFVGVDALPNGADGSIDGVPLNGPWVRHVPDLPLHPAQVSIIYEGYPKQDIGESDANHRYRQNRDAAHVDGLLPLGPNRRRYAQEFHAYILSLPLNDVPHAPTVVWRGSQQIMQAALRGALEGQDPDKVDITDVYQAARRQAFEECEQVSLMITPGESALLHPFVLHGTQPWGHAPDPTNEGRMIAFLRPECAGGVSEWLATP